ncbi:MAG: phage portal protein [Bacilli bacterium]
MKKDKDALLESDSEINFLLKNAPNPFMNPITFIYRITALLFINNNCFIYPLVDASGNLEGLFPLRPHTVEASKDGSGGLYLKFFFDSGESYTLPYENIIHLRRFYCENDVFGGNGALSDHATLIKTVSINDSILKGIDNAIKSSLQIKGLLKMNAMLSQDDKDKQKSTL